MITKEQQTNAELVEKVVAMNHQIGYEVATRDGVR